VITYILQLQGNYCDEFQNCIIVHIYKYWKKWRQSPIHQKAVQKKLLTLYKIAYIIYKKMVQRENALKEKQERKCWVRPIFTPERRLLQGASNNLIPEMLNSNDSKLQFLTIDTRIIREIVGDC